MKRATELTHEFVEFMPADLLDGVLYVSLAYATAAHRCCCGCKQEVVTPLSPTDWKMIFDGETVSLDPSIGSWSFACQSHYWIKRNRVHWAPVWSREQVDAGRMHDHAAKERQFDRVVLALGDAGERSLAPIVLAPKGWRRRFKAWLSGSR